MQFALYKQSPKSMNFTLLGLGVVEPTSPVEIPSSILSYLLAIDIFPKSAAWSSNIRLHMYKIFCRFHNLLQVVTDGNKGGFAVWVQEIRLGFLTSTEE